MLDFSVDPVVQLACMNEILSPSITKSSQSRVTTVGKQKLNEFEPAPGLFPSEHLPPKREAARRRYADVLHS